MRQDVSDVSGGIWRGGLVRRQDVHLEEGVGVVEDNVDLGLLDRGYDTWASGHIKQPQRSCQGASRSNKGAIKELSRSYQGVSRICKGALKEPAKGSKGALKDL